MNCPAEILVADHDWRCELSEGHWGRHRCQVGPLDDVSWEVVTDVSTEKEPAK